LRTKLLPLSHGGLNWASLVGDFAASSPHTRPRHLISGEEDEGGKNVFGSSNQPLTKRAHA
jgi:hypothetical protein